MPIYNGVYTQTITAGGGTVNLDVSQSTITRYIFDGTATLSSSWTIQSTGTPVAGMEFDIRWQAVVTLNGNNVTIFGTALTDEEALQDLQISCYYNGSAWDVDIVPDRMSQFFRYAGFAGGDSTKAISNIIGNSTENKNLYFDRYGFFYGDNIQNQSNGWNFLFGTDLNTGSGSSTFLFGQNSYAGFEAFNVGLGVDDSTINGSYSFGQGYNVVTLRPQFSRNTTNTNSDVIESGTLGFKQQTFITGSASTTDATATPIQIGDSMADQFTYISLINNSVLKFKGQITAFQVSGSSGSVGDTASWEFSGIAKAVAGTVSIIGNIIWTDSSGAPQTSSTKFQNDAAATWSVAITADNSTYSCGVLKLMVTGAANKDISWQLEMICSEQYFEA